MGNTDNLKPFNTMPPERQRELSRRGGKAGGAARRAKRERIEQEKAAQKAENELFRDSLQLLHEATRLYIRSR